MKKYLYILSLATVTAACGDNSSTAGRESKTTVIEAPENNSESGSSYSDVGEVNVDTLGMAEFLALKAAQEKSGRQSNRLPSNDLTETNDMNDSPVDTTGFAAFKQLKAQREQQAYDDSIRRAEIIANRRESIAQAERNASARNSRTNTTKPAEERNESTVESSTADESAVVQETTPPVKEKKGWSNKAKGAVIGAATGAAAGAVINKKNRGVGGVVGGVVGAAAGYGIGRHKDKKDTLRKDELVEDTTDQR